jgi:hypothetical protein
MDRMACVDNHASILWSIKIHAESERNSYCPEATVGMNRGQLVVHRTASEQEAQERELLLLPNTLQLRSTTPYYR